VTERQKTAKKKIPVKTETSKKIEDNHKMLVSAKLIERMVCQNLFDDIVYGKIKKNGHSNFLLQNNGNFVSKTLNILTTMRTISKKREVSCPCGDFQMRQQIKCVLQRWLGRLCIMIYLPSLQDHVNNVFIMKNKLELQ
jgi:hypothetical protein